MRRSSDSKREIPEKHQQVDVELWFFTGVQARSFFIVKMYPVS
jgi:hypothetical protein